MRARWISRIHVRRGASLSLSFSLSPGPSPLCLQNRAERRAYRCINQAGHVDRSNKEWRNRNGNVCWLRDLEEGKSRRGGGGGDGGRKEGNRGEKEEEGGTIRYSREGDLYCGMCSSNVSRGIRT